MKNDNGYLGKLNVGILLEGGHIQKWKSHFIEKASNSHFCNIVLVFFEKNQAGSKMHHVQNPPFLYTLLKNYEYKKYHLKNDALEMSNGDILKEKFPAETLNYHLEEGKGTFSEKDLETIKAFNLDVIIDLVDSVKIPEGLLSIPKHGLWSFNIHNHSRKKKAPQGFWESLLSHTTANINLYLFENSQEKVEIIHQSFSAKDFSVWEHINRIHWKKAAILLDKLQKLYQRNDLYHRGKAIQQGNENEQRIAGREPTNVNLIVPLSKYFFSKIAKNFYKKAFVERWALLYSFESNGKFDFSDYQKILPPENTFWADPFVVHENGRYYIFFESCPMDSDFIGSICCIELDKNGKHTSPVTILKKPYHLSYPFTFKWEGNYYVVPETHQNRTIQLYKCRDFPYQWDFEYNLMDDIVASDVTIFFMEDRWWLFAVVRSDKMVMDWTELHIYYADSPISKNWSPHAQNPVISDVQSARPAGKIFEKDGCFYRPSQDCSIRYGYGVRINQILKLTPREYQEKEITFLEPKWDKNIKSFHTYNRDEKLTVIDGESKSFRF